MFSRSPLPMCRSCAVLLAILLGVAPQPATGQTPAAGEIRQRIETLQQTGALDVRGARIEHSPVLVRLYAHSGYEPLWSDPAATADLLRAVRSAAEEGLDPRDYHIEALESLASGPPADGTVAGIDIARTHALLRLTHDLRFGKVDQSDPAAGRRLERPVYGSDAAQDVRGMIASGALYDRIGALRPTHYSYRGLVAGLADLRRLEAAGGWAPVPAGPALRLGSVDPRVPTLRRRLAGAASPHPAGSEAERTFDAALECAVREFQHRHALVEDGVVGPATLRELNVPVSRRIEQIRVNLERARWILHDLPESFVGVNVAGARVYLVRRGETVHEARAIVGTTSTRTPAFRATMRQIELNPTWTVPPGIVDEVLGQIRRDPAYLDRMGIRVLDGRGRVVRISPAELARFTPRTFPYVFRQEPGPQNPLGRIKFVFPNEHHVYLHDTPARHLFEREERLFSHGCIRVEDPFGLAESILNDPARWSRAALLAAAEPGATRIIRLPSPVPVLVQYWTASADLHGEVHFYRDVYGRDAAVLRALDRR